MNIGDKLLFWRNKFNYTQIYIAEQIEVSERMYRKYETCEVSPPLNKIIRLADIYGITLDELIGRKLNRRHD